MDTIHIFDTTLRDGEQSPGCSMNLREKIEVAKCLDRLKVDVIEAGFPVASPGDFEAVKTIAQSVRDCTVAALARCTEEDIDAAWQAVREAAHPRLHLFLATSPIHMQYKLKMTPDEVVERAAAMVRHAKALCPDLEFSCEDATRSDPDFLVRVVNAAIAAGATVVNLPDTVGYTTPAEMRALVEHVIARAEGEAEFSVHCHNDLGLATANALAGVLGGARQIECTINGIGERAGNTALEEAVMALRTRPDLYHAATRIDTTMIYRASQTIYNIIGQTAPLNKPVVGRNAFVHESGIHQHGVLANKATYEILTPESVGIHEETILLGKHSGRHAFATRLQEMGYRVTPDELDATFREFKELCDKKKSVNDADIRALFTHHRVTPLGSEDDWKLDWFAVHTSNFTTATATVSLKHDGQKSQTACLGDGPIDAAFQAIDTLIHPPKHTFDVFTINSISEGKDTLGDVMIKLRNGTQTFTGRGLSTDIIEASIFAYLGALNKLLGTAGALQTSKKPKAQKV